MEERIKKREYRNSLVDDIEQQVIQELEEKTKKQKHKNNIVIYNLEEYRPNATEQATNDIEKCENRLKSIIIYSFIIY